MANRRKYIGGLGFVYKHTDRHLAVYTFAKFTNLMVCEGSQSTSMKPSGLITRSQRLLTNSASTKASSPCAMLYPCFLRCRSFVSKATARSSPVMWRPIWQNVGGP